MTRDRVFISYSQHDKTWKDAVVALLKGYERRGHLRAWADDYIQIGDDWRREIDDALAHARAAVLLVSPDFVRSDFIMDVELPALLAAVEQQQLFLCGIAVRSVDPDLVPELTQYQWWGRPEAPLDRLPQAEREEQLVGAMKALVKRYHGWTPKPVLSVMEAAARQDVYAASPAQTNHQIMRHIIAHGSTVGSATELPLRRGPDPLGEDTDLGLPTRTEPPFASEVDALPDAGAGCSATLHGVPELPPHFVTRAQALAPLKRALLEQPRQTFGIAASGREGLYGQGGIGKTVLAIALARDSEVGRAFADGIYWLTVGQTPDVVGLQRALYHEQSGVWIELDTKYVGTSVLHERFVPLNCLLVLDDVWQREHAEAFQILGPHGRLLVTSRDRALLDALGARVQNLEVLTPEDALQLLAQWAGVERHSLPEVASKVALECGRLPLALAHAGAQVLSGIAWQDLLSELTRCNVRFLDHPHGSVFASLSASVRALPPNEAARYAELAIFPEDIPVPARVIERLWSRTGLDAAASRQMLARFAQRALLALESEGDALRVRFHDLQGDYLRVLLTDTPALHARLLDAYQVTLPEAPTLAARWAALAPNEAYLWEHLVYHALEAGQSALVNALATDARWLGAKVRTSGVSALEVDLARLMERAPSERVRSVERAVRLESAWLHEHPEALDDLLYNRLRADGLSPSAIEQIITGSQPRARLSHPVNLGGAERRQFRRHTGAVWACAYSPDGTRVLSASDDNTLREWDRSSGKELRSFEGHYGAVRACAYSPDGTRVLSASDDNTLREWDRSSGKELRSFEGHTDSVTACAYSTGDLRVLSGSHDKTLREWDRSSGKELRRFVGHSLRVSACAYSTDRSRVLSGSHDKTLREWDRSSGKELRRFEGHSSLVTACAYSPDGSRILSASHDKTLREWDQSSGEELRRFVGHTARVTACAYSSDGSRVLSASWDNTLCEWDRVSGEKLRHFEGHSESVTACAYCPDGFRVLSASLDNTLREWDLGSGNQLRRLDGANWVTACTYSPDGSRVLSAYRDNRLREWDLDSSNELRCFEGHSASVLACAYSPNGTRVLSASWDTTLREWDRSSRTELRCFFGHSRAVTACAYSPDASRILSASDDKTLREWDRSSGKELRRYEGHLSRVTACAYSPDGRLLLSASDDNTLCEWDRSSGRELRRFRGHTTRVTACTYSSDGRLLLSASDDNTLCEWDRSSGKELRRFKGHTAGVTACAYSPNNGLVLSASFDSTVKVWQRDSGECVHTVFGAAPFFALSVRRGHIAAGDRVGNVWMLEVDWVK